MKEKVNLKNCEKEQETVKKVDNYKKYAKVEKV